MEVYIAEKPSLARAIADGLGVKRKEDAHIVCEGGNLVTWCFGHILQDCMPEDYDPAWKDWRRLPVIPQEWRLKPDEDSRKQLMAIGELLQKADAVVHAGDPDREGQAIVDEVLEYFHWRGPTRRLWLASLDALSVKKALGSMKDNAGYAHLRDAAIARRRADWLVGLNIKRALTNVGRDCGHAGRLSAGRVQSAVLNLVVARDRERAAFTPQEYLVLQASFSVDGGSFLARFRPGDTQSGLDAEGRLVDLSAAEAVMASVRGQLGRIVTLTKAPKQKNAPLPYSLSALQKAASAAFSMTAKDVLQTAQSLYEKKLTTYPRTDCRYLPVEQLGDAARILGALASVSGLEDAAKGADAARKSGAWDTGKVTAHHAIIPTGETPGNLTEKERAVYQMIARAYIMQFYGPFRCETQKLTAEVAKTLWDASGRLTLDPGWTVVGRDEEEDEKEEEQALPAVSQGDAVTCADVEPLKKKTSPPARWTEGTLIEAMANVHRFVPDVQAKAVLKENEGIGTEATRADALEKLKEAGYIKADGKALVSTRLGMRSTTSWKLRSRGCRSFSRRLRVQRYRRTARSFPARSAASLSSGGRKTGMSTGSAAETSCIPTTRPSFCPTIGGVLWSGIRTSTAWTAARSSSDSEGRAKPTDRATIFSSVPAARPHSQIRTGRPCGARSGRKSFRSTSARTAASLWLCGMA